MKVIELTQGYFTLVDSEDYYFLKKYKWYAAKNKNGKIYVKCAAKINGKLKYNIYLHKFILNIENNKVVDHINGNTLDNRKENLRICSSKQNSRNRIKSKNNTSGYKGVIKDKNKWRARITVNYKLISLGYYDNQIDAAKAYDNAAIKYFGEFARLNFSKEEK